MKGTLTKVKGGQAMRTDTIEGSFREWPKPGERFFMIAPPLDPTATVRVFTTSRIVSIDDDILAGGNRMVVFTTESGSQYEVWGPAHT